MGKLFLDTILPHLIGNWGRYALAAGLAAGLVTAKLTFDGMIDAAEQRGRVEAVEECNTVQLEEDLLNAQALLEQAEKRNIDLREELDIQREETEDQRQAFEDLERQLVGLEDGAISERTIRFVEILSARSAQYQSQPDE